MARKRVVLMDDDERYLQELSYYFMEKVPQFELLTFTKEEKLYQYFDEGGRAELLAVDEKFVGKTLEARTSGITRVMLSVSMASVEGFVSVKKYQKLETLVNTMLLTYAEESNTLETVRGSAATRIVSFYSPAGGTGKTTLALALAAAASRMGLRVLYLNLEEISSTGSVLPKEGAGFSDLFLALQTKGMNVGIRLKSCAQKEPAAGFYYIADVDSISEYEEIDGADIERLLRAARELADYDLVITDHASGCSSHLWAALKETDMILVPASADGGDQEKLERFLKESQIHDRYDSILGKMRVLLNRVCRPGTGVEALKETIRSQVPCCTAVMNSPALADKKLLLASTDALIPVMAPVLQTVMGDSQRGAGTF